MQPPPFDVAGPSHGRTPDGRLTVTPHSWTDSVADLVAALDIPPGRALAIDGRVHAAERALVATGVRCGSEMSYVVSPPGCDAADPSVGGPDDAAPGALVEMVVVAGPDCGRPVALTPGRYVVGRAVTADLRIVDPTVELHHGVIEVGADGRVSFVQLTGRCPVLIDPPADRHATELAAPGIDASPAAGTARTLTLGTSLVTIRRRSTGVAASAGEVAVTPRDPWRRVVRRGPPPVASGDEREIDLPMAGETFPSPPATGLIGAGVGVVGAAAVALVLGQLLFALFALVGAVASVGAWACGWITVLRSRRRDATAVARDLDRFLRELHDARNVAREAHQHTHPSIEHALREVSATTAAPPCASDVWCRRVVDAAAPMSAAIGRGRQRWIPPVARGELDHRGTAFLDRFAALDDVAVSITLRSGDAVAIRGPDALVAAVARSVIVQLAASSGPADWRLVVVTSAPASWAWAGWLPHADGSHVGGGALILDTADDHAVTRGLAAARPDSRTVLVVEDPGRFTVRTGPVRRFIDTECPATIALVGDDAAVPAVCGRVLGVGSTGTATWIGERLDADDAVDIRVAGVTEATASTAARGLAALVDPEDDDIETTSIASSLSLADLDVHADHDPAIGAPATGSPTDVARNVARRWRHAGDDPAPLVPVGRSADGLVEIDLVRDGPHGLIAGTTGSGKSELLRTLVIGLALRLSPTHLTFVLVDYKGGSTFDACARLPHTVGVVTDLDAGLAERALVSLDAELRRRERLLRAAGASDLTEYRRRPAVTTIPRLVVVIDEFAALAKELPDFLAALVGIAQRGRSLGVHLLLATQRPAGVVNDDIRANTNLRLALRLHDTADALDVVGDDRPARFPREVPGRATLRLGPGELVVFQSAHCSGPVDAPTTCLRVDDAARLQPTVASEPARPTELDVAVAAAVAAAELAAIAPPHRPWIEPLPSVLAQDLVESAVEATPHDVVGLVDDPAAQTRRPLRWDHRAGNLALVGGLGTGTSSTLIAVVAARCRTHGPDALHCYVVDARGDGGLDGLRSVAHCGGVVHASDRERLHRLLARLAADVTERGTVGQGERPDVVVAIDGLGSLRSVLATLDDAPTLALLDRVLTDGPAVGIAACWTAESGAATGSLPVGETWMFGADATRSSAPTDPPIPGRVRVGSSGLVAQVALGAAGLAALPDRAGGTGPPDVGVLARVVAGDGWRTLGPGPPVRACVDRAGTTSLPVGVAADDLGPAILRVPALDHVFIGGAAQSGKSTALSALVSVWCEAHPAGTVLVVDRRSPLAADDVPDDGPTLVVADDADRIDDPGGTLAAIVASGRPNVTIVAAARVDAVRSHYGHWTRDVARSRCGVILTSAGDDDGDLLGVTLPRRSLMAPRPGLGWVIDTTGHRLVQLALHPRGAQLTDQGGGVSPSNQRGPVPSEPAESSGL